MGIVADGALSTISSEAVSVALVAQMSGRSGNSCGCNVKVVAGECSTVRIKVLKTTRRSSQVKVVTLVLGHPDVPRSCDASDRSKLKVDFMTVIGGIKDHVMASVFAANDR